jgi:hypothetical protein
MHRGTSQVSQTDIRRSDAIGSMLANTSRARGSRYYVGSIGPPEVSSGISDTPLIGVPQAKKPGERRDAPAHETIVV